jgi:tetratricopeptide (TPR) repeat protein
VAKVTAAAVGDAKEPREVIRRILASIERDIRYAGVEFGEGSIFPRAPGETLRNKYGDCKDKATLLVAMLRQAGIPAHAVLVNSGFGVDVEPDLPGLGHFNHVIVRTDGPDGIWIDPTDEFARAGELPDSDQGRLVLVAKDDTTALVRTPLADSTANHTLERREFWLAEDGKARVLETNEYHGSDERSNRRYYNATDAKTSGEAMKNYAQQAYLSKNLVRWDKTDPRDLSKPFVLTIEMKDAQRGLTTGGESVVAIFYSRLVGDIPAEFHQTDKDREAVEGKPRKYEYLFAKPYNLELQYVMHPPLGYEARTLPAAETMKLGTATITKDFKALEDGTVVATFKVDSGARRITATQFEELRQAVVKLNEGQPLLFSFDQKGQKFLEAGEVGKAVAEFRRVSDLHPKEGLHHADIARALLAGGLGAAARREAKRAVEIDPKSPRAYATLGMVLTNDLIGRPMHSGCDIKGAIAAYKKAKELAPADLNIRSELGLTLEHSDEGIRYGDPARMEEAIAEYLAMKKDIETVDKDAVDRQMMPMYARLAKWDDLKKLLAETKDVQMKDTFTLIVAGASEGGAAAVNAASQIALAQRRDAMTAAGGGLMVLRYYPAAADLISAAAQGSPNAAQLRAQADMIRKATRYEDFKVDPNDAASLMKSVFLEIFTGTTSEDDLNKRYATADVAEIFAGKNMSKRRRAASNDESDVNALAAKRALLKKDMQSKVIADLAISAFMFQKDGDENVGIRLRGRAPGAPNSGNGGKSEFTAYVVRENGQYRFAATDDSPAEFGLRALRLAEKNEVPAARQWLDWAREHVMGGGDDPVSSHPFAALWTRGKEANADEVRLAAAVLLPDTKKSAELALPVLEAARATASPDVQWRIDQAMLASYQVLEQWSDALKVADRLIERFPDSGVAFQSAIGALSGLERYDELRNRATTRLEKIPGDMAALQVLGSEALRRGAYADAVKYYAQVLDRTNAGPGDYNDHAWASIFAKTGMETALEHAQQAAAQAPSSYAILNTLATVYAEQGNSSEARDTLLKSLDQLESDELTPSDWYVVGRIAENYGILDAATEAYKSIPKPKRAEGSSWALAQQRLHDMK